MRIDDFIETISVPRHRSADDPARRRWEEIILAMALIAPIVVYFGTSLECKGPYRWVGFYPDLAFPKPSSEFCSIVLTRIVVDYGVLCIGALIVLGLSVYLRRRSRVFRPFVVLMTMMAFFGVSVIQFQRTFSDIKVFVAEGNGRLEELFRMRTLAREKGLTEVVEFVDARFCALRLCGTGPAP